jgi:hypothetical protein
MDSRLPGILQGLNNEIVRCNNNNVDGFNIIIDKQSELIKQNDKIIALLEVLVDREVL